MCVPAGSGRDAHDLLRSHRPACFRAAATCFGALLAMLHVVRGALFRAPFADLCAQGAQFLMEGAVPRHRIGAQAADRSAFDAASGTVVRAFLPDHVVEAIAAFGGAVVAAAGGGRPECRGGVRRVHRRVHPPVHRERDGVL